MVNAELSCLSFFTEFFVVVVVAVVVGGVSPCVVSDGEDSDDKSSS